MTRFIHYEFANNEWIYITEDEDSPVSDFVPTGATIVSDTKEDIELPATFPLDHPFEKSI